MNRISTLRTAFPGAVLVAWIFTGAASAVTYSHDDGIFDFQGTNTAVGLKSLVSLHRFTVIGGANLITSIEVAWPSVGLVNGDPTSVILWSDPNLDGNPTDAQVLVNVPATIQLAGTGTYVSIDIPDTFVGTSFFAGSLIEKNIPGALAARMADGTAPISGQAWFADFVSVSADLNNLSSATFFGNPTTAEWGIRATGIAVPEPATAALGVLSLGGMMLRRRRAVHMA